MESRNISSTRGHVSDDEKKQMLRKALKNGCPLDGVYVYAPHIGADGIYERVRITWAKDFDAHHQQIKGILDSPANGLYFRSCKVEDAFAYYYGL